MIILGLNLGHDASATILVNNKVKASCEQERYNKIKHTNDFPVEAIRDCLKISKINFKDIDIISVGFLPIKYIKELYLKTAVEDENRIKFLIDDIERIKKVYNIENLIRSKLRFKKKIEFNDHHLCHLASAYYPSGLEPTLLVSYDGLGEFESGYFAIGKKNKISIIHKENKYPNSLGLIYAAVTFFLGWKINYDEGIIMGLAPYGNPKQKIPGFKKTYIEVFRDIIQYKSGLDYKINKNYISYHKQRNTWVGDEFLKIFGKRRLFKNKLTIHHKNIAAALQLRVEEVVLKQLRYLQKKYKYKSLGISGGVGLNCSLNGKIHNSGLFKNIFVQPASGDAGLSYGTAILSYLRNKKANKLGLFKNQNFYLGSSFKNTDILKTLKKFKKKLNFFKSNNIFKETSLQLNSGKIIGWFQGSSEFGPRALGNRSIICKPFPKRMKDHLNKNVKFREEFRPFAPAIIDNYREQYFQLNQRSDHMLIASKIKSKMKKKVEAIVHIDDTCRVQTVTKNSNERFYKLLTEFNYLTNIPVLLNTSFNVKGQPIVNNPEDAIKCFLKYKIDLLAIGDYLVSKKSK